MTDPLHLPAYPEIAEELIRMKNLDLQVRDRLMKKGLLDEGYHPDMAKMHHNHARELEAIIDRIGYPTIDKVGREASEAAWLIIQHAIGHPAFMRKCLTMLSEAVDQGKADPRLRAYLSDRIATFEGRNQKYGTAFDWDVTGNLSPLPYDDLSKVNARRRALGLNTLEEQTVVMRQQAKKELHLPPRNYAARQEQYDAWRKKVGWIT